MVVGGEVGERWVGGGCQWAKNQVSMQAWMTNKWGEEGRQHWLQAWMQKSVKVGGWGMATKLDQWLRNRKTSPTLKVKR